MATSTFRYTGGRSGNGRRFDELDFGAEFDGIWACASLLHVPERDQASVLPRLATALVPGGYLYASYKRGDGERFAGGRRFTDVTLDSLVTMVAKEPELDVVEVWETADRREDRPEEFWISAILRRRDANPSPMTGTR